ncbi:acyl-CoA dehydrogenase family protein [Aquabacterium sp.]|uniref:acyl-CoA dehydrogenase family protein n=1 Tax=Aquabacterium sp. TaxID=1872578 RepID=UPI002B8082FC|nr:acyl-CoA dehydrogenase family protein [Aquabacterium sp.]HSW06690.1 acyl-CoA dehydrogenase family protein [Aquabacterium sp.]
MARMLGDAAQRWAAGRYALAQRRPLLELPGGFSAEHWREQAEMGWLALRLPETHGGLDADPMAIGALMEVVGSHLLMEPILASAIVATGLVVRLASESQRTALAPRLATGGLKLGFTGAPAGCEWRDGALHGKMSAVLHGDVADQLLVAANDARHRQTVLLLVDAQGLGVQCQRYRLVDGRGAANLEFRGAAGEPLVAGPAADAAIEAALQEATAALCAEALGIMRALVAATCEYLKLRQQFGRAIGNNQVLQHRVVEMFVLQEEAAALTAHAQQALVGPARERAQAVSAAKAYIARAARQVANEAVQMHGGVGITDELAVSHHFRRLMVNAALFGSRDEHFACYLSHAQACVGHGEPQE